MRFASIFLLLIVIGWREVPQSVKYIPRKCNDGISIEVMNKDELIYSLAEKYDLRVSSIFKNNPDLDHILYLLRGLKRYEIPERIGIRWVYQESRFDSAAISPKGAYGYCQIMPETWDEISCELGFENHTSINNIEAGMYYLSCQYKKFGRWDLALAAYNSGPFRKCISQGRVPRIPETQEYVKIILN